MKAEDVPLSYRFIETISPGFFFGNTCEMKWPKHSWTDCAALANELKQSGSSSVGFRRFTYGPCNGKTYLDEGWKYFKGRKFTKDEILSGSAKKDCPGMQLTDTAISNVKSNGWDCLLWLAESNKLWPLGKEDKVMS